MENKKDSQMDGESLLDRKDQECLKILKQKIKEDNDDKFIKTAQQEDDEFLLRFVRGKKHNVDKALKTLKNYFYSRDVSHKEYFERARPSNMKHVFKKCPKVTLPLIGRDKKGRAIGVFSFEHWNTNNLSSDELIFLWLCHLMEDMWADINVQRNGLVLVTDNRGFGLRHLKLVCSTKRLNMIFNVFMNSFPIRIAALHYIDPPLMFDIVLKLSSALMPAKLRSRVFCHYSSDWSTLYQHIPANILPDTVGGELTYEEAYDTELHPRILANEKGMEKS